MTNKGFTIVLCFILVALCLSGCGKAGSAADSSRMEMCSSFEEWERIATDHGFTSTNSGTGDEALHDYLQYLEGRKNQINDYDHLLEILDNVEEYWRVVNAAYNCNYYNFSNIEQAQEMFQYYSDMKWNRIVDAREGKNYSYIITSPGADSGMYYFIVRIDKAVYNCTLIQNDNEDALDAIRETGFIGFDLMKKN